MTYHDNDFRVKECQLRPSNEERASLHASTAITTSHQIELLQEVHAAISSGAEAFLRAEYSYCIVFELLFGLLIFALISHGQNIVLGALTTLAFFIGAFTSILSGYIGMKGETSIKRNNMDGVKVDWSNVNSLIFLI